MQLLKFFFIKCFILLPFTMFSQTIYKLSGEIKGANDSSKVYLFSKDGDKDSSYIIKEKFSFIKRGIMQKNIFFIYYKSKKHGRFDFPLFIEESGQLNFTLNENLTQFIISGDKNAKEQNEFYVKRRALFNVKKKAEEDSAAAGTGPNSLLLKQQLLAADAAIAGFPVKWIMAHRNSPFSVAVLRLYVAGSSDKGAEDTLAEKLYDKLSLKAKQNNAEADILESWFEIYNDKYSRFQPGSPLPDFKIYDTVGKLIQLSNFENKYLLIDFWASWCGPCRANNPHLKDLYDSYKSKGLEVLSISVDTDKAKWLKAIKADEMSWHQGSDLKGQNAGTGFQYRITSVPLYILISPQQKIITKSIGGDIDLIKKELDSILK